MKNREVTKYLKLPFQFDENKLVKDLTSMMENSWTPHFNPGGYEGNWKAIPLYANGGDATNIFAFNNSDSAIVETPIMKNCLYFKEVVYHFKCPLLSVRLLNLGVGAKIKPHRDYQLGYENDNFRLHIPIITNDDVIFVLDGDRLKMLPGECWYTNVNYTHAVCNNGDSDRVHLVIDGKRNTWTDDLFFSLAPKESFLPKYEESYSAETIRRIIEELQNSDLPVANQIILKLQDQLNALK